MKTRQKWATLKYYTLNTLVVAFLHFAMFTPNLNSPPLPSNPPLLPTYASGAKKKQPQKPPGKFYAEHAVNSKHAQVRFLPTTCTNA